MEKEGVLIDNISECFRERNLQLVIPDIDSIGANEVSEIVSYNPSLLLKVLPPDISKFLVFLKYGHFIYRAVDLVLV